MFISNVLATLHAVKRQLKERTLSTHSNSQTTLSSQSNHQTTLSSQSNHQTEVCRQDMAAAIANVNPSAMREVQLEVPKVSS